MKCKVIRPFIDKVTGKRVEKEYSCTKERFEEIQKQGNFLEPLEVEKEQKAEK